MDLAKYDGKCVRITLKDGEVYEGVCIHDPVEYIVHEIGGDEDALEMSRWIFYNSQIERVEIIGEDGFSAPYGRLEEETLEAFDLTEEVLSSEEPISVLRLLCCIEDKATIDEKLEEILKSLLRYNDDEMVKEKARKILSLWRDTND